MTSQPRIVLLGPPGAGKGTQAAFIASSLNIPHISTGDMMRAAVRVGDDLSKRLASYLDNGELVPDAVIIDVVRDRVGQDDCCNGFLLDGFPRTLDQAKALDELLTGLDAPLTHIIDFQVPTDIVTARLLKRAADSGRSDDTAEVIENRMKVYEAETQPVSAFYADRLRVVDGVGTIDEIKERISGILADIGG